jgi:hypothetical protein
MPIYPYSFTLPPVNKQDIPSDGVAGEFLGISAGGVLDWLPVAGGGGDLLAANNLSELTATAGTARTNLGLGTGNSPQFTGIQFSTDTFLTRGGAANLQLGAADAAAPVAQTLSVQSVVAGTTNTAGVNFTIDGSQGTGLGAGGSIIFRTAPFGSAGSTVNALGTHMILGSDGVTTLRANGVPQLRMISIFGSGSVFNGLTLESDTSTLAGFLVNRSSGEIKIGGLSSAGYFPTFYSNNAERMRITTTGNVGIGTTAPRTKLHLEDTAVSPAIEISGATIPNYTSVGFSPQIGTNTNGRITTIGTTYGGFAFAGFSSTSVIVPPLVLEGYHGANVSGIAAVQFHSYKHNGSTGRTALAASETSYNFSNATTSLLTILGSGNVGIGTTAPTAKLHVAGTIKPEQATMVDKAAGFTLAAVDAGTIINSTSATAITINLPAADTATGYNVMIIQSGAGAVTIAANGNTLNSFGGAVITAGQHAACSIVRTAASTYNLSGNLV